MHKFPSKRHILCSSLVAILSAGLLSPAAQATTRIWDGNGATDNWSYVQPQGLFILGNTNWTDDSFSLTPLPNTGDALVFQGINRLTPHNDLNNLTIADISFAAGAGAFTLNGNGFTSTGNISNNSSNLQTFYMPITVGTDQTWDGGAPGMAFNGRITLDNHGLTLQNKTAISNRLGEFFVGESGTASLALQSGGSVSSSYGFLGMDAGSTGTVTVIGTSSLWANSGELTVGNLGSGTLNIQNGGQVSNTNGYLGYAGKSTGTATVTGTSSLWANSRQFYVGYFSSGALNVQSGGQVNSAVSYLGYGAGSTGTATVAGADTVTGVNSLWASTGNLVLGTLGSATLNILSGGSVTVGETLSINRLSTLDLNGGSLTAKTLTIATGGQFNWTVGSLTLNSTQTLTPDGWLSGLSLNTVNTGKVLRIGGALNINDYASLSLNGGQLSADSLNVAAAGNFDWQKGKLQLSTLSLGPGNGAFGDYLKLDSTRSLTVTGDLGVSASSTLDVGSGASTSVGHNLDIQGVLALGSGRIAVANLAIVETGGSVTLSNAATARLAATNILNQGLIAGSGRLEGSLDNQAGGKLSLSSDRITVTGNLENEADASIEGRGVLSASSLHNAGLMAFSGGQTDLSGNVSMTGGQGRIINSGGGVLTFFDNVVHNGQEIQTGSGTTTVFIGNVSGAGGFTGGGQTLFEGSYNPGNSPAAVDFHGGDATFNAASILTMEIFGGTPGTEYDRLFNINTFSFNGTLNLIFGNGYTPTAGSSLDLFGFNLFSGLFDPTKINVTGFDRSQLDFSQLAVNGKLGVSAAPVPLPTAFWLFGCAAAGLAVIGRRRRSA